MGLNIGGTSISKSAGSVVATDASNNRMFTQNSSGVVSPPQFSGGGTAVPLARVGLGNSSAWTTYANQNIVFNYTSGSGYYNVGSVYNTSNGRFTAPFTGLYLFTVHLYCRGGDGNTDCYFRPMFYVNGGIATRRPNSGGAPYRMRLFGIRGNSAQDGEESEVLRLVAGDYVNIYFQVNTNRTQQIYPNYSGFSATFLQATA